MAYQETTGNSPDDVIDKIATFAAAAGWTVVKNDLVGSNRELILKRTGSDYIQVWNNSTSNIYITGYVEYDPLKTYDAQVGYAGNFAQANVGVGPYANVFMFSDNDPSDHVHVVIEMSGGRFRHLSFGMIDKLGTWTGGTYFDAVTWSHVAIYQNSWNNARCRGLFDTGGTVGTSRSGAIRCDIPADGRTNAWAQVRQNASYNARTGLDEAQSNQSNGDGYLTTQCYNRNNPPFSGQVTLGTIRADVVRTGGFYSVMGSYPNVRYLGMARYSPGQEITVGPDTWKVFPMVRKGSGAQGEDYSQNHAYAYKKVS